MFIITAFYCWLMGEHLEETLPHEERNIQKQQGQHGQGIEPSFTFLSPTVVPIIKVTIVLHSIYCVKCTVWL